MSSDYENFREKHVRLLSNAYVDLLLPPIGYTGTIKGQRKSEIGNRTEYLFVPDKKFIQPSDEKDFWVSEDDFEVMSAAEGRG
jgi:hypothetical protein